MELCLHCKRPEGGGGTRGACLNAYTKGLHSL